MPSKKKTVIQKHHIKYEPEETVLIYKGEHWVITLLNRHTKNISVGFIECLKGYVREWEFKAIELDKPSKE